MTEIYDLTPESLFEKWNRDAYKGILEFYDEAESIDLFEDTSIIMTRLVNNMNIRPFSEYLRFCLYNYSQLKTVGKSIDEIPDRKYFSLIQKEFASRDMENIASLDPKTPHDLDRRFLYRIFRRETVSRETVFLFAFGLGMGLNLTELFLTRVIKQSSFNFKDYREAVYYYCLKNNLGYSGVIRYLELYENLAPKASRFSEKSYTIDIKELFEGAEKEEDFLELLADIKNSNLVTGLSRKEIYLTLLNQYRIQISAASFDNAEINNDISLYNIEKYTYYPDTRNKDGNMRPNNDSILKGKKWFLSTRLTRQNISMVLKGKRKINRNDIITLVFLNEDLWAGNNSDIKSLLGDFTAVVNDYLLEAGFTPFCFDSPYESFIAMCLISENPQDTYRCIWSAVLESKGNLK